MAAPTRVSRDFDRTGGQTTSHVISDLATASYAAGDMLVVLFACDSNSTPLSIGSSSGGWTLDAPHPHSTGSFQGAIAWKIAESSSENLTISSSPTVETSSHALYIARGSGAEPLQIDISAPEYTTTGTSFALSNFSPAGSLQDYLAIGVVFTDSTLTYSSASGDYAANFGSQSAVSTSGASVACSDASFSGVSTVTGATFSAGGNRAGLGFMIAVWEPTGGPDVDSPTMTGAITVSAYTEGGGAYTVDWPAATDNVAVTGYEISLNNGSSWTDLGNVLTYSATGRTPGTTDQIRVRAYDAAANVAATPLSLDLPVGGRYIEALSFKSNGQTNSDVKLIWANSTGDMPPRTAHLTIHWSKYRQQTGYYANWWTMPNLSSNYADITGDYFSGYHPYPCDGLVDPDGTPTNPTSSSGTEHYYEIAGLPNTDIIGNAADESLETVKDVWVASAHYAVENGSNTDHVYYPDLFGNPSFFITATQPTADITGDPKVTSARALMFGANTWTVTGSTNAETPSGEFRGIRIFDITSTGAFSVSDMQAEATAAWNSTNAPATSDGTAAVWYINDDPTSTDVTDKSGEGHDPVWGTSYRPDDYQEIVEAAGATIVSATKALAWSVRNLASATQGVAWSVRNLASATQGVAWSVRNLASATQSAAWSVRNSVAATQSAAWSVRNYVTSSQGLAWSVEAAAALVSTTVDLAWSVRNYATGAGGVAWSVRNLASSAQGLAWTVRNVASTTQALAWTVRSAVSTTRALAWSVRGYAASTAVTAWTVRNLVTKEQFISWSVESDVVPDPVGGWPGVLRRRRR